MADNTEHIRRNMLATGQPQEDLAADTEEKWTAETLSRDFEVLGFMAPFVVVRRKSDGCKGSLMFTHMPRFYFSFREE